MDESQMSERRKELYSIINDFSDYLQGGIQGEHSELVEREDTSGSRAAQLEEIAGEVRGCTACSLHFRRDHAVPGEGVLDPLVMVIGEGPGGEEDKSGRPFVGRAGQYLDKWLEAIGLSRESDVFIGNIVKCRPPKNRDPLPEESSACIPFLRRQLEVLRPKSILTVGRISSQILLNSDFGIGQLRGKVYSFNSIPLVPTYHPSGVLRNPSLRPAVWEDLKLLRTVYAHE